MSAATYSGDASRGSWIAAQTTCVYAERTLARSVASRERSSCPEKTGIATIPVGYGDGYPRSLSNKGYVLVCGRKARILGRVCMDQMMVDITDIPQAKEGSLCTLIGTDAEETITMESLGDLSGRFNYELACDINARVPRVVCGGTLS